MPCNAWQGALYAEGLRILESGLEASGGALELIVPLQETPHKQPKTLILYRKSYRHLNQELFFPSEHHQGGPPVGERASVKIAPSVLVPPETSIATLQ